MAKGVLLRPKPYKVQSNRDGSGVRVTLSAAAGLNAGDEVYQVLNPRTGDLTLTRRRPTGR